MTQATVSRDIKELGLGEGADYIGERRGIQVRRAERGTNYVSRLHRAMAELSIDRRGQRESDRDAHAAGQRDDGGFGDRRSRMAGGPRNDRRRRHDSDRRALGAKRRPFVQQRFADLKAGSRGGMSRIVLAYSGGLDTSVLLKKLRPRGPRGRRDDRRPRRKRRDRRERRPRRVGGRARQGARASARTMRCCVDARERFIAEYAFAALRANALYQGVYPLSAALSRPLIAELLVETAHEYGASDGRARLHRQRQRPSSHRARRARARSRHWSCRAPLRE